MKSVLPSLMPSTSHSIALSRYLSISTGFFSLIVMLMFFGVKEEAKEIVFTLLGSFGTAFGMAMSYFFGSSEGSKEKTKLLGDK